MLHFEDRSGLILGKVNLLSVVSAHNAFFFFFLHQRIPKSFQFAWCLGHFVIHIALNFVKYALFINNASMFYLSKIYPIDGAC